MVKLGMFFCLYVRSEMIQSAEARPKSWRWSAAPLGMPLKYIVMTSRDESIINFNVRHARRHKVMFVYICGMFARRSEQGN